MTARKPGRPADSKTTTTTAVQTLSVCPHCGSTERTPYTNPHEQLYAHEHNGHHYTHLIRRRTTCANCNLPRIDRTRENRPDATPPPPLN